MKRPIIDSKLKIRSISYVHDPEAAQKWFEMYVEILTDGLIQKSAKMCSEDHINDYDENLLNKDESI
ncbi:hypothetical protein [Paenibacillus sp. B2(2019)]|uniref:hypothetical protein n=1 Tax=Paenibacillus sp. B2(2019) TaxID=2607754 RepID=UPI0011F328E0|nr:hypothetical protein [Paenibacillus sp. B2(2019)]KAA1186174.1 hypothetical protein PAENI_15080 [Paenibacillus sp. B2(2019)]